MTSYASTDTVDQTSKIPTGVIKADSISPTSDALTCFREQKFSANLQAYLISYNMSINSYYAVYK